jgi:hypothetical protein
MDKVAIKLRLEGFAKEASSAFLGNETSLSDSVRKIATREKLSTEEIHRVCEAANVETFNRKYASEDNKMFEFPLAKASDVIQDLNEVKKTASVDDLAPYLKSVVSVESPEKPITKVATERGRALFTDHPEDHPELPTRSHFTMDVMNKCALLEQERYTDLRMSMHKLAAMVGEFSELAKQYVLDGHDINKLAEYLGQARPQWPAMINVLCEKTAEHMHIEHKWKGGLDKTAAPVAQDLINPTMSMVGDPVQVINGNNPMIQLVDTTVEQAREVDKNMVGYFGVRDFVKFVRGKVTDHLDQEYQLEVASERV